MRLTLAIYSNYTFVAMGEVAKRNSWGDIAKWVLYCWCNFDKKRRGLFSPILHSTSRSCIASSSKTARHLQFSIDVPSQAGFGSISRFKVRLKTIAFSREVAKSLEPFFK